MPEKPILFLSDEPLSDATLFNVDRIVSALHEVITSTSDETSLNICISGGWGSGKTTVLRTLLQSFNHQAIAGSQTSNTAYISMWFDPWKLSTEVEARDSLIRRIMALVESDADFLNRASIAVDRKNVVRLLSERLLKINADQLSAFYRLDARAEGSFDEIEELFRRIAMTYLNDSGTRRRIIVFVDDLDRCRPSRVVEVLEAVKLFFDLPGMVFVFGLDRDQVAEAIAISYDFPIEKARVYLEKVFQLTYVLPQKGMEDLTEFVIHNLERLDIRLPNKALAMSIVNRFGRNLRNLKLFMNSFSLQRRLVRGPLHQYEDELLFKWLYLETTMPRSLSEAIREASLNLIIAFELLAFGGMLHDVDLHNRYLRQLRTSPVNFTALAALSMLSSDAEPTINAINRINLPVRERVILDAVRADGEVPAMLGVLREGHIRLLDKDLRGLALLTRLEDVATSSIMVDPAISDGEQVLEPLNWGGPLPAAGWDTLGDRFREAEDYRSAYIAHLMAVLVQPDNIVYLADLAKDLRSIGRVTASAALLRRAYEIDRNSVYVTTELAYLYDVGLKQKEVGNQWYWKAIARGSSSATIPANLSINLSTFGDNEMAYLASADAYLRDRSEKRLNSLRGRAQAFGRSVEAGDFESQCRADLDAAIRTKKYPRPLSAAEESQLETLVMSQPVLSLPEVIDELSRPPF
jgi:KAP family P-loop domain